MMVGDPSWQDELERAADLAVEFGDVHEAAALGDALIWGHLFTGDPTQCARVAGNLIAATADVATGWNRYFRAASLLARAHVEGDHESVCSEGERLLRQPLTDRTRDLLTAAMVFCLLDGGRDLDAVELAEADWDRVWRRSREDTARATAGWVLTEAQWLAGNPQRALEVADQVSTLDVPGYVGVVGSATMAAWAARALDQAPPASTARARHVALPELPGRHAGGRGAARRLACRRERRLRAGRGGVRGGEHPLLPAGALGRRRRRGRGRRPWPSRAPPARARAGRGPLPPGLAGPAPRRHPATPRRPSLVQAGRRRAAPHRRPGDGTGGPWPADRGHRPLAAGEPGHRRVAHPRRDASNRGTDAGAGRRAERHRGQPGLGGRASWSSATRSTGACGSGAVRTASPTTARTSHSLPESPWWLGPGRWCRVRSSTRATSPRSCWRSCGERASMSWCRRRAAAWWLSLLDALGRLGMDLTVAERAATVDLDDGDIRLLLLLGGGASIDEAGRELGLSRRTTQRRLEAARRRLGVSTNREAIGLVTAGSDLPARVRTGTARPLRAAPPAGLRPGGRAGGGGGERARMIALSPRRRGGRSRQALRLRAGTCAQIGSRRPDTTRSAVDRVRRPTARSERTGSCRPTRPGVDLVASGRAGR